MCQSRPQSNLRRTTNPLFKAILDDREVLGRVGFAKIELIEKIQAVIRGAIARKQFRILKIAASLREHAFKIVEGSLGKFSATFMMRGGPYEYVQKVVVGAH